MDAFEALRPELGTDHACDLTTTATRATMSNPSPPAKSPIRYVILRKPRTLGQWRIDPNAASTPHPIDTLSHVRASLVLTAPQAVTSARGLRSGSAATTKMSGKVSEGAENTRSEFQGDVAKW